MATNIRTKLAKSNPYWIPMHRRCELEHFCKQYHDWKMELRALDGRQYRAEYTHMPKNRRNDISSPVEDAAIRRESLKRKIEMIESIAEEASDSILAKYVVDVITGELSFAKYNARKQVPCNRNEFTQIRHRFFWLLDKQRD